MSLHVVTIKTGTVAYQWQILVSRMSNSFITVIHQPLVSVTVMHMTLENMYGEKRWLWYHWIRGKPISCNPASGGVILVLSCDMTNFIIFHIFHFFLASVASMCIHFCTIMYYVNLYRYVSL